MDDACVCSGRRPLDKWFRSQRSLILHSFSKGRLATPMLSVLTRPHPKLHILRHRPHLVPFTVLAHQILAIPIADLRHVCCLALRAELAFEASVHIAAPLAAVEKAVRSGIADKDCEASTENHEEGHQDSVHGGEDVDAVNQGQ